MTDPHSYIGGRWTYSVLKSSQSVSFFDNGTHLLSYWIASRGTNHHYLRCPNLLSFIISIDLIAETRKV